MRTILCTVALLFTAMLFSQSQNVIKGSVTDKAMNNEPMLFANVKLKGSNTSYQTNFHGYFEISDIEPGSHILVISYAGYETQEVTVVVEKNTVSQIKTILSPMEISFEDVAGIDTASKQEAAFPRDIEKSPRE